MTTRLELRLGATTVCVGNFGGSTTGCGGCGGFNGSSSSSSMTYVSVVL